MNVVKLHTIMVFSDKREVTKYVLEHILMSFSFIRTPRIPYVNVDTNLT